MKQKNERNDRKEEILQSALITFCKKGYDGTTVDDIVRSAGCSHGLFYHYFENKKEVFDAIIKYRIDNSFNQLVTAVKNKKTPREKLRAVIESMFGELKSDENYPYYFYFLVSSNFTIKDKHLPPPENDNDMPKLKPIEVLSGIFAEGQKCGCFIDKYSPRTCARLFNSVISGITLGYVIAPKDKQKDIIIPDADFILDIFSKGDFK